MLLLLPQKEGVHMKGFAPSLDIMLRYRVLLAPLRYGAGLKGKVGGTRGALVQGFPQLGGAVQDPRLHEQPCHGHPLPARPGRRWWTAGGMACPSPQPPLAPKA